MASEGQGKDVQTGAPTGDGTFGLVYLPVIAHHAGQRVAVRFVQLQKREHSRQPKTKRQ